MELRVRLPYIIRDLANIPWLVDYHKPAWSTVNILISLRGAVITKQADTVRHRWAPLLRKVTVTSLSLQRHNKTVSVTVTITKAAKNSISYFVTPY